MSADEYCVIGHSSATSVLTLREVEMCMGRTRGESMHDGEVLTCKSVACVSLSVCFIF